MASTELQKIIIDTDCGIDDAIALLLALSSKDVAEILAITCCSGNTSIDNVCSNVMRVLTVCEEKSIPIHRGSSGPLIKSETSFSQVHGTDGFGECAHEFSTGELEESDIPASLALINLARNHPKEITLVAIGPLTNLAIAHRIDPKFTENLKSIVILGGNYKGIGNVTEVAEFNFFYDPDSANIILTEAACPVKLVPWETVMENGIPWDLYRELTEMKNKKGEFLKSVSKMFSILDFDGFLDCDVLAVTAALWPESVKSSKKCFAAVELQGTLTRGMTVLQKINLPRKRRIEIITDFHKDILHKMRKRMV